MATNPVPEIDPVEEEGVRLLKENPELLASLEAIERRVMAEGYVPRDNHNEARRIVGLDPLPD